MRLEEDVVSGFEIRVAPQFQEDAEALPDVIRRDLEQVLESVGIPTFRPVAYLRSKGFVIGHRWRWGGKSVTSAFEIRLVGDTLFVKRYCRWEGNLWGGYLIVACIGAVIGTLFIYTVMSSSNRGVTPTPEQAAALPILSAFLGGFPGSFFGLILGSLLVSALFDSNWKSVKDDLHLLDSVFEQRVFERLNSLKAKVEFEYDFRE